MDHLGEVFDLALRIADWRQFHVHMLIPARRMVDVQHALRQAALQAGLQRTGLSFLVARAAEVVRNLVALPPGYG
jgi:hypothetical protein